MPKISRDLMVWGALGLSVIAAEAMAYSAPVPAVQLVSALHWRNVGPYIGGRVNTVAGVADKSNLYYAGMYQNFTPMLP